MTTTTSLTGAVPEPDAEATRGERAHAKTFAELVDKTFAGRTPPAMSTDDRALLEVATVIRAAHGGVELSARAQRTSSRTRCGRRSVARCDDVRRRRARRPPIAVDSLRSVGAVGRGIGATRARGGGGAVAVAAHAAAAAITAGGQAFVARRPMR